MDDVRAIMDAGNPESIALFGLSEGGPMSIVFAATYPQRSWRSMRFLLDRRGLPTISGEERTRSKLHG